ncbi:MAG: Gfo/Idh/MocA family oxidoreductase [Anditalea sp.]
MMEKEASLSKSKNEKLGIALVGLGKYAKGQLAPALKETKYCQLTGIVTGSPDKIPEWKEEYGIQDKNMYNYDNFDEIASNKDIDIIYVVLPNSLHMDYTIRAANAGKHVICEKPMATSVEECEEMIAACNKNKVRLGIGYRLHFDPHHQYVMELGQGKMGRLKHTTGEHSMKLEDTSAWRLKKDLAGGGPLMDVGIYVVQASCYTAGHSPIAVKEVAFGELTQPEIYQNVEQSISWTLEFPDGVLARGECSYARNGDFFHAEAANGSFELKPAYPYNGIRGKTSEGTMNFPEVNQQAFQMDEFADALIQGKETIVPGEMGLRDVAILMAIYEAAESGKAVPLNL